MSKRTVAISTLKRALIVNLALLTLVGATALWSIWYTDIRLRSVSSKVLEDIGRLGRAEQTLGEISGRAERLFRADQTDSAGLKKVIVDIRTLADKLMTEEPELAQEVAADTRFLEGASPTRENIRNAIVGLENLTARHVKVNIESLAAQTNDMISDNKNIVPMVTVAVICGWLGALLAITYALSRIQKPMGELLSYFSSVADRDLSAELPVRSGDEFGDVAAAAVRLNGTLTDAVRTLGGVSEELAHRGEDLTEGANRARRQAEQQLALSSGGTQKVREITNELTPLVVLSQELRVEAEQSAAFVQQIVASARQVQNEMQGLSEQSGAASGALGELEAAALRISDLAAHLGMAAQTVSNSAQAIAEASDVLRREAAEGKAMTEGVVDEAAEGTRAMEEAFRAMARIRESVDMSLTSFRSLDTELAKIDRVTQVIEDIAGRTNLLSLNAAIIASQAGEQGHAFGVVAGEIRALAEKTALSTKEIQSIVKGVAKGGRVASEVIEGGVARVAEGEKEVRKTGELLEKIHKRAEDADRRLLQIDAAAQGQAAEAVAVAEEIRQVSAGVADIVSEVRDHGARVSEIRRSFLEVEEAAHQTLTAVREQGHGAGLIAETIEKVRIASEDVKLSIGKVDDLLRTLRADMEIMDLGAREELDRTQRLEKDGREMAELSGRIRAEIDTFHLPQAV